MSEMVLRRSATEVRELRAREAEVRVLDVRTRDARELHPRQIAGAHWVPLSEVVEYAHTVPRETPIVTYCT
jgi:rhodanese-related sulfurtransferase